MIFMIATMIFILAFPTMAGAMTGYTSVVKAYVPDITDANMIRFDGFDAVIYVIHDGRRIKIQDNQIVTVVREQSGDSGSSNVRYCSLAPVLGYTKTHQDPIISEQIYTSKCKNLDFSAYRPNALDLYADTYNSNGRRQCAMQTAVSECESFNRWPIFRCIRMESTQC